MYQQFVAVGFFKTAEDRIRRFIKPPVDRAVELPQATPTNWNLVFLDGPLIKKRL
jgi:hypothetical protein